MQAHDRAMTRTEKGGFFIRCVFAFGPILWFFSYFALVVPEAPPVRFAYGPWQKYATYRVGGCVAEFVYSPMVRFDRHFPPAHWTVWE